MLVLLHHADPQTVDPNVQSDVERFIWNYLAIATAANTTAPNGTDVPQPMCRAANATACPAGTVCAGYRDFQGPEGSGACVNATARFVPSYSTALECVGCNGTATFYDFRWRTTDQAQQW